VKLPKADYDEFISAATEVGVCVCVSVSCCDFVVEWGLVLGWWLDWGGDHF